MTAPPGVSPNDFTQILNDFGVSVTYKTGTKTTSAITGTEKFSYVDSTITAIVFKERQRFTFDPEGILENGDAYIMVPTTQAMNKGDRVVFDGETYEISPMDRTIIRKFAGTSLFNFATLHKMVGKQA